MGCPMVGEYGVVLEPVRIIQEKLNGYTVELGKDNGVISATLRGGRDIWTLLKKNPAIVNPIETLPDKTTLYCELHCPEIHASAVITMLNSGDTRLQLTPFAVGRYGGKVLNFKAAMAALKRHGITPARCIRYSDTPFIPDAEELLRQILRDGIEGYVLKVNHLDGWYKLKPVKTVDAFVVAYTLSESKTLAGGLKSFVVGVHDNDGLSRRILADVSSGFDYDFKRRINPKDYLGRVMEVSYCDVLAKGRLQFPKFIRWREDKTEAECTIKQVA